MRGKRTPGKSSDTSQRAKVRFVKFTPEEMAYEAPSDVSDPKRYPTLAKGQSEWLEFLSFKRGYIKLDPALREFFKDDREINDVLRQAKAMMQMHSSAKKRKSA